MLVGFRNGNQRLLQALALLPSLQVAGDGVNESLLFRQQEGLVFGVEHPHLPAQPFVHSDVRSQFVC